MNGWFQGHAGLVELVLVEGIVLGLAVYELRSVRRALRRDREAFPPEPGNPRHDDDGQSGRQDRADPASPSHDSGRPDGRPSEGNGRHSNPD